MNGDDLRNIDEIPGPGGQVDSQRGFLAEEEEKRIETADLGECRPPHDDTTSHESKNARITALVETDRSLLHLSAYRIENTAAPYEDPSLNRSDTRVALEDLFHSTE